MRFALILLVASACGRSADSAGSASAPAPQSVAKPSAVTTANPLLPCPVERVSLGRGLTVERWPIGATPVSAGPACIDVVRADPAIFKLDVLSQATDDPTPRSALAWRDTFHLSAVINAGMFHDSGAPVGMIISDGTVRAKENSKMSGFLAWDPVTAGDPPVVIAGRDCPGFDLDALRTKYHSVVQSYRWLGCDGQPLPWKDPKHYSAAGIGLDRSGRIVFLHARAAVTMAELSIALSKHDLVGALFL